jgi:hypothetical protein
MLHLAVLLLPLWLALPAPAVAAPRPSGTNCDLKSPPTEAGEEMNHGVTLRVFPRAKSINSSYSGCQVLFAPAAGSWHVVSIAEVAAGDPTRIWSEHAGNDESVACRYKNGTVVEGNADKCPHPEFLLIKSMAPGCVKLLQEAVAKGGLGAATPAHCQYE